MSTSSPERYVFAEQLYCWTDKSMPEIAELTGIPLRSLYHRSRKYKWEVMRRASRRSPMVLVEEMYRELSDLTEKINQRPIGQRLPTKEEAELRKKIVATITAIKKFTTHAEATFLMQSLLRYNDTYHGNRLEGLQSLVDAFLAHRDIYGFASYQPEHDQDVNQPNEQDLNLFFSGPEIDEAPATYRHPDNMRLEQPMTKLIEKAREKLAIDFPFILNTDKTRKHKSGIDFDKR
jgi:hypothetical protein